VSAASGCAWWIACATAAFRAVVRPDQVPLRGATTSIAWVLRFPLRFDYWWWFVLLLAAAVRADVGVWSAGGFTGSFRLVPCRACRFVSEIGRPVVMNTRSRRSNSVQVQRVGVAVLLSLARKRDREYWRRNCRPGRGDRTRAQYAGSTLWTSTRRNSSRGV
jgi:hypothetical protein